VGLQTGEPWQTALLLMALLRLKAVACLLAGDETDSEKIALAKCRLRLGGPGLDAAKLLPVYFEGQDTAEGSMLTLEQPATILFHADHDGRFRAILHTYGNHYYGARGANHAIRLSSGSRWLSSHPLHDAGGLSALFRCLLSGAALVMPSPGRPLHEVVARHEITHADLSLEGLEVLLARGGRERFPALRAVLVEGGEAYPDLLRKARAADLPVYPEFGIPEVASGISIVRPGAPPARRNGAGAPIIYREVSVNSAGDILVRGQALFAGYIEPLGLRRPVDNDGWFDTGAQGRLEGDGELTVLDPGNHASSEAD